ncbi:pyrroline-5-carboxylate reductase [Ornithinibacillus sp. L9]|uniref:Pyrroline-5-carboxylate reductase n=1 Tax=Ornithinibacillus caprae TaxID=2678566 RepID=A0A6N8FEQ6_9BACI|nr:pyrroline-5-carboxylate reductase [Ornithinibacillus caprae]MUK88030.1 pyrroline-5-carboxylate reductase [Ornithinibacillus caprae]
MDRKIGFIGSGKMAEAIIGGIIDSEFVDPENVFASNRTMPKLLNLKATYGIQIAENNVDVAKKCDIVFLAITPDKYASVIYEIKDVIQEDAIVVLIAVGQSIAQNEERFSKNTKVVKAMPNTPVLVGEGLTSIRFNSFVTDEEKEEIKALFESFGKAEVMDESLMDAASAVGGSSPAFVYMYMEALADAAVLHGMPREQAYRIAAQSVLGSAKMMLETGLHPGKLKDDVCSPGGSTIQSVASLEESGFRSAVIKAVQANVSKLEKK